MSDRQPASIQLMRPLEGLTVGVSVSAGEDAASLGFSEDAMNQSVIRLADRLLAAGACLAFGHDWRPHGVMAAVAQLAARYQPDQQDTPGETPVGPCRITNFVAWDDEPELSDDLREDLENRGMLRIVEVPPPALPRAAGKAVLRALALSRMRAQLADLCDARICLGGKTRHFAGYWPGILEEAWLTARRERPLFVSGMLGGAAQRLLQAAREHAWQDLPHRELDRELWIAQRDFTQHGLIDLPDEESMNMVWGWESLQHRSGLDPELWRRLVEARDIEVVASLVILALSRRET